MGKNTHVILRPLNRKNSTELRKASPDIQIFALSSGDHC